MLEMLPDCEECGIDLPPNADALICSFECTFCMAHDFSACPNCGGALEKRPTRAAMYLDNHPASAQRKYEG